MIKDPELLKLAVKAIEAEPERWYQGSWASGRPQENVEPVWTSANGKLKALPLRQNLCDTTMCLAGHVVHQAGYQIVLHVRAGDEISGRALSATSCVDKDGILCDIESVATSLLGLSEDEADELFGCGLEDLDEFKQVITQVTGVEFE